MTFIPASPKQQDFIAGLAAAKDIPSEAAVALFAAATSDKVGKDKASDLIDSLMGEADRAIPEGTHVAPEGSPWAGSRLVVKRSKGGRLYSTTEGGEYLNGKGLFLLTADTLAEEAAVVPTDVPEGIHVIDGEYRQVVRSKAGRLYAKGLNVDTGKFSEYLGMNGLVGLSADTVANAEQAAAFGHLHHRCVFCSTSLTDERSQDVGYGPRCAEVNGLPWG